MYSTPRAIRPQKRSDRSMSKVLVAALGKIVSIIIFVYVIGLFIIYPIYSSIVNGPY